MPFGDFPVQPGRSILQQIWERLDWEMDQMMEAKLAGRKLDKHQVGRSQGLAEAIAIITSPYAPNIDAIREQAIERWEARNA